MLARAFIVKAVRPQRQNVRRADVDVAVDQVAADIDLAVCRYQFRVNVDVSTSPPCSHLLVMDATILCRVDDKDRCHTLFLASVFGACFSEYHCHNGILVRGTASAMIGQGIFEREIADDIAADYEKIAGNEVPSIEISHGISYSHGCRF